MTLTSRLSVFFLTMIGVVLVAFSAAFYWFASTFLRQQAADRAAAAITTLMAAVESHPEGVEWEAHDKNLDFGTSRLAAEIVWSVIDASGTIVDRSEASIPDDLSSEMIGLTHHSEGADVTWLQSHEWLIGKRLIEAQSKSIPVLNTPPDVDHDGTNYHQSLSLRVAVSLVPIRVLLQKSAITLVLLTIAVWVAAFAATRSVCRHALRPLRQMTLTAQEMNGDNLTRRLEPLSTCDEPADLTNAFNGLLDRLQDSFLRQQRFTGDASHQLRTPLAAILGQIEVAQRRDRSIDEYKCVLSVVHGRANIMKNIVESLLFLARADAEAMLPGREVIELVSFLNDRVLQFADHRRFTDLRFEYAVVSSPISVSGHPTFLGELLTILLDNAFKFSEQGTSVEIQLMSDATTVSVSICDQGGGISSDDLPRLGTPFFRAESARLRGIPGEGLGVAIAFRLAKSLNGHLSFSSTEEQGTVVRLTLPLVSDNS